MKWKKQKESKSNSLPHDINMVPSFGISLKIIISFTVISASAIPVTESTPSTQHAIPVTESTPSTRRAILEDPDDDKRKKMPCCRLTWHQKLANPLTVCKPVRFLKTFSCPEKVKASVI